MSDIDIIRRSAERGLRMAHEHGNGEFVDIFQHIIDESARVQSAATSDVMAERRRQKEVEGWTTENDDEHQHGEMASAAACYASMGRFMNPNHGNPPANWPWAKEWWKPSNYRRNLVKAAALILAEIERVDRVESQKGGAA